MLRPRSQPRQRQRISAVATALVLALLMGWLLAWQYSPSTVRDAESMTPAQLSAGQRFIASEVSALAHSELEPLDLTQEEIAQAQTITLMTILQESSLRNLDSGDADSQGLFQQRPSMEWGTEEQVRDPQWAVAAFLGTNDQVSNPGLLDVDGWQDMSPNDAAQEVQRSAHPQLYGQWEPLASALVEETTVAYYRPGESGAGSADDARTDRALRFQP